MSSYLTKSVLTCYNISTSEVLATTLDSSLWILCFGVLESGSVLTSRVLDRVSRGTLFNSGPDLHSLLLRIELGKGLPVLEVKQLACVSLSFSVSVFVLVSVIVLVCLPVLEVWQLARIKPRSKGLDIRDHRRVKLLQSALSSLSLPLLTNHGSSEHDWSPVARGWGLTWRTWS